MNKHRFHLLISILIVVALSLLVFAPAQAEVGKHILVTIPVDDEWPWPAGENPCGFDLYFTSQGNLKLSYFYDKDGNELKNMWIDGNLKVTISANGKTVDVLDQGPQTNIIVEYVEGGVHLFQRLRGTSNLITAPGIGRLFSGGGQFIEEFIWYYDGTWSDYTVTIRGKIVDYGNLWEEFQPVCEYFLSE